MKLAALLLLPACLALAQVPTPESVLGHKPGDDFYLASYDDSLGYFKKLAAASNRIQLVEIGKTSQGRDWWIAFISNPKIWRGWIIIRTCREGWRWGAGWTTPRRGGWRTRSSRLFISTGGCMRPRLPMRSIRFSSAT